MIPKVPGRGRETLTGISVLSIWVLPVVCLDFNGRSNTITQPTPTCRYPKSDFCLGCQPGEGLNFLLFQPGFDRSSSKTMCSHQMSVHGADSACVQPQTPFASLTWMLECKGHGLRRMWGKSAACEEVPELEFLESWCVCFVWATVSLTTTDVVLAGSCCHGWSDALHKQA